MNKSINLPNSYNRNAKLVDLKMPSAHQVCRSRTVLRQDTHFWNKHQEQIENTNQTNKPFGNKLVRGFSSTSSSSYGFEMVRENKGCDFTPTKMSMSGTKLNIQQNSKTQSALLQTTGIEENNGQKMISRKIGTSQQQCRSKNQYSTSIIKKSANNKKIQFYNKNNILKLKDYQAIQSSEVINFNRNNDPLDEIQRRILLQQFESKVYQFFKIINIKKSKLSNKAFQNFYASIGLANTKERGNKILEAKNNEDPVFNRNNDRIEGESEFQDQKNVFRQTQWCQKRYYQVNQHQFEELSQREQQNLSIQDQQRYQLILSHFKSIGHSFTVNVKDQIFSPDSTRDSLRGISSRDTGRDMSKGSLHYNNSNNTSDNYDNSHYMIEHGKLQDYILDRVKRQGFGMESADYDIKMKQMKKEYEQILSNWDQRAMRLILPPNIRVRGQTFNDYYEYLDDIKQEQNKGEDQILPKMDCTTEESKAEQQQLQVEYEQEQQDQTFEQFQNQESNILEIQEDNILNTVEIEKLPEIIEQVQLHTEIFEIPISEVVEEESEEYKKGRNKAKSRDKQPRQIKEAVNDKMKDQQEEDEMGWQRKINRPIHKSPQTLQIPSENKKQEIQTNAANNKQQKQKSTNNTVNNSSKKNNKQKLPADQDDSDQEGFFVAKPEEVNTPLPQLKMNTPASSMSSQPKVLENKESNVKMSKRQQRKQKNNNNEFNLSMQREKQPSQSQQNKNTSDSVGLRERIQTQIKQEQIIVNKENEPVDNPTQVLILGTGLFDRLIQQYSQLQPNIDANLDAQLYSCNMNLNKKSACNNSSVSHKTQIDKIIYNKLTQWQLDIEDDIQHYNEKQEHIIDQLISIDVKLSQNTNGSKQTKKNKNYILNKNSISNNSNDGQNEFITFKHKQQSSNDEDLETMRANESNLKRDQYKKGNSNTSNIGINLEQLQATQTLISDIVLSPENSNISRSSNHNSNNNQIVHANTSSLTHLLSLTPSNFKREQSLVHGRQQSTPVQAMKSLNFQRNNSYSKSNSNQFGLLQQKGESSFKHSQHSSSTPMNMRTEDIDCVEFPSGENFSQKIVESSRIQFDQESQSSQDDSQDKSIDSDIDLSEINQNYKGDA